MAYNYVIPSTAPDTTIEGGTTTLRWGTAPMYNGFLFVLSADQEEELDTEYYRNGSGKKTTRVITRQGGTWNVQVRDDSNVPVTLFRGGSQFAVYDYLGLFGVTSNGFVSPNPTSAFFMATIVGNGFNIAAAQDGKRSLKLEYLRGIEGS